MKHIIHFCQFIVLFLIGTSLTAQLASTPTQNPRPANANHIGSETLECSSDLIDPLEDIYLFVDVIDDAEQHTIPSSMPNFHVSVSVTVNNGPLNLLFVSDPINVFTYTDYICQQFDDGFIDENGNAITITDRYYYAEINLNPEVVAEYLEEHVLCIYDLEGNTIDTKYSIVYRITTYNSNGELIPYPLSTYPDYFNCYDEYNGAAGQTALLCCLDDTDITDGGSGDDGPKGGKGFGGSESSSRNSDSQNETLSISPNPFNQFLVIEEGIKEIRIISIEGRTVLNQKIESAYLNTSNLNTGIYIVQYFDGQVWNSEKMIKSE